MRPYRAFKYLAVLTLPATVGVAFVSDNWLTFLPLMYAFGFVPLVELLLRPDDRNLSEAERELVKHDGFYDGLVRLMPVIQFAMLVWFCYAVSDPSISTSMLVGRITAMGMLCGVVGINVAHELGHRPGTLDQTLSKALLLSSLYTHFFIEHNRGHHKNVATRLDPASARKGEALYTFWLRSMIMGYLNAWELERRRLQRAKKPFWSLHNEMIRFQLLHLALLLAITLAFGWLVVIWFIAAALMGGLLLETVNYIEHYGLQRAANEQGNFGRVLPVHSWNSNHVFGRILLFELSRHSDHHYKASKPYQLLDSVHDAPQLPTGYPGMMLLALFPPLFFTIMNRKVAQLNHPALAS